MVAPGLDYKPEMDKMASSEPIAKSSYVGFWAF